MIKVITFLLTAQLLLVLGCVSSGDSSLSFFFDGVEPDAKKTLAPLADRKPTPDSLPSVVHEPYREGDCSDCHDIRESTVSHLNEEIPKLCYACHGEDRFNKETVHSPVEDGECMECHNPHKSSEQKLLRKPVIATCFGCHEGDEIDESHAEVKDSSRKLPVGKARVSCIQCHDPHSSDLEFLIRVRGEEG